MNAIFFFFARYVTFENVVCSWNLCNKNAGIMQAPMSVWQVSSFWADYLGLRQSCINDGMAGTI